MGTGRQILRPRASTTLSPGWPRPAGASHDSAVPPEYWVHNLEHGGVAILFSCSSSCDDDKNKIKDFLNSAPAEDKTNEVKIVATQYPVPSHRFAVMAWGWRLFLDRWDAPQVEKFYQAHADQAPELIR